MDSFVKKQSMDKEAKGQWLATQATVYFLAY